QKQICVIRKTFYCSFVIYYNYSELTLIKELNFTSTPYMVERVNRNEQLPISQQRQANVT
ncbi:MAG: hypothetical protein KDE50_05680, partial [Caldilineaceae bacterium]|nr:hypothetical protein [Caldilineaceae bacterium]